MSAFYRHDHGSLCRICRANTQGEVHCSYLQDHEALPLCMTATLLVEEAVMLTDQDILYRWQRIGMLCHNICLLFKPYVSRVELE